MPYIPQERRDEILFTGTQPQTSGELNFQFTTAAKQYITARGGLSYAVINDIIGALEGCKLEFYRRVAVPYENKKIAENGDVF
jgi:uncharacterized protein DUF6899